MTRAAARPRERSAISRPVAPAATSGPRCAPSGARSRCWRPGRWCCWAAASAWGDQARRRPRRGPKAGAGATAGVLAMSASRAGIALAPEIFRAGDPAPVALRSPALPAAGVMRGMALPRGTAVVRRTVALRADVRVHPDLRLGCPAGLAVADLLSPTRRASGRRLHAGHHHRPEPFGADPPAQRAAAARAAPRRSRSSASAPTRVARCAGRGRRAPAGRSTIRTAHARAARGRDHRPPPERRRAHRRDDRVDARARHQRAQDVRPAAARARRPRDRPASGGSASTLVLDVAGDLMCSST